MLLCRKLAVKGSPPKPLDFGQACRDHTGPFTDNMDRMVSGSHLHAVHLLGLGCAPIAPCRRQLTPCCFSLKAQAMVCYKSKTHLHQLGGLRGGFGPWGGIESGMQKGWKEVEGLLLHLSPQKWLHFSEV